MTAPRVGVVVLAYGDEPWLADCLRSVTGSRGVDVDVVLVDNDCRPDDLAAAVLATAGDERVTVLSPGHNTGFAGGCNLGASHLRASHPGAEYLALVNSDCVLEPGTLAALVREAGRDGVGPVMASIRLADTPELLNSAGNPVHVLGICWAGGLGEPETRDEPFDVPAASGACLLLRRTLWDELAGFDDAYFAYLEDTELSLRCRRRGWAVRCVPDAPVRHHYEFSRNPTKMYLLERNRLMLLATLWSGRALLLLAPALVAFEIALLGLAVAQGWGRHKVRGWVWVVRHRRHIAGRRRLLQAERTVGEREWTGALSSVFDVHVVGSAAGAHVVNAVMRRYWRLVRALL